MTRASLPGPMILLVIAVNLGGCVFKTLEKDLEKLEAATFAFDGTVSTTHLETRSIIVVAMTDQQGDNIAGFSLQAGSSQFEMRLPSVPTYFLAFNDLNQDLRFQADEPFAWAANLSPADPASDAGELIEIDLDAESRSAGPLPEALVGKALTEHIRPDIKFNVGTVSSLDNPWFSLEQAKKGLWEPYAFMADGGTGVHFLEPYDPDRTPVLFVHGILGSPLNFKDLIESVDTDNYQVWFYSYPSGLPLDWLAGGMTRFLEILDREYDFDELHVVAHSMGGLVSRGGINQCLERRSCEFLRRYVSISSPWGGVQSAQSGVKWAPTVPPVWRDIDPDSDYIATLFDTTLPGTIPHYLLFGFRQDSLLGRDSSDGVIKLESQLRLDAQEQAQLVRGFDEGHVTILSNANVISLVNEILQREDDAAD